MDVDEQERIAAKGAIIAEIMLLAYWVNSATDYCVFVDYYGHVDSFMVKIAKSKERYNEELASTEFYTRHTDEDTRKFVPIDWLKVKRDHLKSLLDGCEIEDLGMDEVSTIVTTYEF